MAEVRIEALCALALREVEHGSIVSVRDHVTAARSLATRLGAPRALCVALRTAGLVAAAGGDHAGAAAAFDQALTCAQSAQVVYEQAQVLSAFAAHAGPDPARADRMLAEARAIDRRLGIVTALTRAP
jgi:hypothetical protein